MTTLSGRLDAQLRSTLRITDSDLDEEPMELIAKEDSPMTAQQDCPKAKPNVDYGTMDDIASSHSIQGPQPHEAVTRLHIAADGSVHGGMKTPVGMLKEIISLAAPASANFSLIFVNQTVSLMFIGHQLGVEKLAAFALGQSVYNVLGLSVALGFAGAIDTFAAQAFGRDPKGSAVAKETQRGWYICLLLCLPLILILLSCEPLVSALFGAKLAPSIMEYLRAAPYPLLINTTNFCLTRAFQAQRLADVTARATFLSALFCPLFNYFLTHHGIWYATIAYGLSLHVECCVLFYEGLTNDKAVIFNCAYPLADRQILSWQSIRTFLALGVPIFVASSSEWWAFELQYLVVSQLSHAEIAAFNICLNILIMAMSVPIGNSSACCTFTGNCLGAGFPRLAKAYMKIVLTLGAVLSIAMACLIYVLAPLMMHLYTTDHAAIAEMASLAPFMALCHLMDSSQSTIQGVFRGAGKQEAMAKAFLVCSWLIASPINAFLALRTPLRLRGIMVGFTIGYALTWIWLYRTVNSWSFRNLAIEAAARATEEQQSCDGMSAHPSRSLTGSFTNTIISAHPIGEDCAVHNVLQETKCAAHVANGADVSRRRAGEQHSQ